MDFDDDGIECVEMSALISDLLGIEEDALAAMAPPPNKYNNDFALIGLQEFLRRVFMRSHSCGMATSKSCPSRVKAPSESGRMSAPRASQIL